MVKDLVIFPIDALLDFGVMSTALSVDPPTRFRPGVTKNAPILIKSRYRAPWDFPTLPISHYGIGAIRPSGPDLPLIAEEGYLL